MEKEQKEKIEEAIGKMFDEYVEKLKKDLKAAARHEVDQKLHQQGTSLASLKVEFRYRLLADEYLRQKSKKPHVVGRPRGPGLLRGARQRLQLPRESSAGSFWKSALRSTADRPKRWPCWRKPSTRCGAAKISARSPRNSRTDRGRRTEASSRGPSRTASPTRKRLQCCIRSRRARSAPSCTRRIPTGSSVSTRKPAGRSSLAEVQETIKQKIEERVAERSDARSARGRLSTRQHRIVLFVSEGAGSAGRYRRSSDARKRREQFYRKNVATALDPIRGFEVCSRPLIFPFLSPANFTATRLSAGVTVVATTGGSDRPIGVSCAPNLGSR